MSSSKSFSNLTQEVWNCVQTTSVRDHGTKYTPPPPSNKGTSSTGTAVGQIDLTYDFDPSAGVVHYTITHKPFVVTQNEIWNGIQKTIDGCR